jgi:hypothetical protein
MRRILVLLTAILFASFLTAPAAQAASPHFKKGGSPVCTTTVTGSTSSTVCKASLAGLGTETLTIDVTVSGFAVYQCRNAGGNIAPGQNKVLVGPTTTPTTIDASQIKNGTVTFTTNAATLSAPSTVSAAAAGCPNSNWTGVNPKLTTTGVSMTISQGGTLLFTCGATNSTKGLTGTYALKC